MRSSPKDGQNILLIVCKLRYNVEAPTEVDVDDDCNCDVDSDCDVDCDADNIW
ncbi:hypothetical protein KR044_008714 [Drosophila immigrans]|nr:hypothetical protein KR044_008714 [Drosophila immigrans]